jgi:hypothetical protein
MTKAHSWESISRDFCFDALISRCNGNSVRLPRIIDFCRGSANDDRRWRTNASRIYIRDSSDSLLHAAIRQIRDTHRRGMAPCYSSPGLSVRVIRDPPGSGIVSIRILESTAMESRGNSISFRSRCREGASVQRANPHFYSLSCECPAYARVHRTRGHLLPHHENFEKVAPFRSWPCAYTTRGGCYRNFRWIVPSRRHLEKERKRERERERERENRRAAGERAWSWEPGSFVWSMLRPRRGAIAVLNPEVRSSREVSIILDQYQPKNVCSQFRNFLSPARLIILVIRDSWNSKMPRNCSFCITIQLRFVVVIGDFFTVT